ncbi:MAG: ABC transporter permease subunit, partial [Anaerolineales bacterium]|nr:ABC transporter permease subunit [Anaerolineales bacterium]
MQKIKTIIRKEWAEVFKNRLVLSTVLFLPLLFTAIPLIMLFMTRDAGMEDLTSDMPAQFAQLCPEDLTGGECFQVYMVNQFMILFMMIPLIIPINIAAYSIVGEKTTRSLEPLLATPITTTELLSGKNLA